MLLFYIFSNIVNMVKDMVPQEMFYHVQRGGKE